MFLCVRCACECGLIHDTVLTWGSEHNFLESVLTIFFVLRQSLSCFATNSRLAARDASWSFVFPYHLPVKVLGLQMSVATFSTFTWVLGSQAQAVRLVWQVLSPSEPPPRAVFDF